MRDVAEATNLSVATVSRHINGSIKLPRDTMERIDSAIQRLNYRPNPHARSLSLGRTESIGVVIPDIANPFFARLAAAVERAAAAYGLGVMLCATLNQKERELDYLQRLARNHVDGLIFVTNRVDDGEVARAINAAKAVVVMDEDVDGTTASKIFADNERGGALAARHLIAAGHRRMAYLGGAASLMSTRERLRGFQSAIDEAGLDPALTAGFFGSYTIAHGLEAARAMLDAPEPPTAVFAASDEIALGVLTVCRDRGIRIGRDLSLVAFDDVGPLDLFDPPLTAIRQDVDSMGWQSVVRMLDAIKGEDHQAAPQRVPVELIVRASVGPPVR
ncbi:LacI family DNA-binding transcriptional regulator [Kaistia dalseonensis]|uniref:LacI family transcriptional regulator n=1 Tax=Kaistia dalseonensis TaxID=410840 RepID=A0ABU0HAR2_9HYPH|nr:LacI family DNA-binding transcriptional regulator [Kaistia dalseonensis]MDQ0439403.1 LacI family transcriptional regulator [Kaistia dalseonensis]